MIKLSNSGRNLEKNEAEQLMAEEHVTAQELSHAIGMSREKQIESDIWAKFKEGDQDAFQFIFRKYYSMLFNYGRKLLPGNDDIDDILQELFLKIWNKRAQLSEVVSIKAYLITSFRRIALDHIKKSRKYIHSDDELNFGVTLSVEDITISEEMNQEEKRRLKSSVEQLTKRQREIIYLRFYEGLSYDEIEAIVHVNYQTIRNCVYEAIKVLKRDLLSLSIPIILSVGHLLSIVLLVSFYFFALH